MLRTITKLLGICIDINIEILILILNRLALEITFLLNQCFSLQMAYELLSESRKLNKCGGGWKIFEKNKRGSAY